MIPVAFSSSFSLLLLLMCSDVAAVVVITTCCYSRVLLHLRKVENHVHYNGVEVFIV